MSWVRFTIKNHRTFFDSIYFTANLEDQVLNNQHDTDVIRERWVSKLETLVANISSQFSSFFERMGFAGDVRLNKGNGNEDDFSNYGFGMLFPVHLGLIFR